MNSTVQIYVDFLSDEHSKKTQTIVSPSGKNTGKPWDKTI